MNPTQTDVDRAVAMTTQLKAEGYFDRVEDGDQRAASYLARLAAYRLNPTGRPDDFGCLSKIPSETNVDGFAEDAVCFGNNPADRENVIDLVNGAGAPGASVGGGVKPRRENNRWVKPVALTDEQTAYLLEGRLPKPVQSGGSAPAYPSYEALGGDEGGKKITRQLEADYRRAGKPGLDGDCGAWQQRVSYDFLTGICKTVEESITKHRKEWCDALGIPVV